VLVAGLEHRGCGGVAERGTDDLCHVAQRPAELLAILRVDGDAVRLRRGVEEGPHRRDHSQRPLVAAEPGHRLGELRHGIVVVDHRAVPGGALHGQPHPLDALLGRLHRVQTQVVADGEAEPPDLADPLRAALEQLGTVVGHPVAAENPAGLLIGREAQDDGTGGRPPRAQSVADDRQDHRVHVLHVDRTATP
jgi:hypothetical protein